VFVKSSGELRSNLSPGSLDIIKSPGEKHDLIRSILERFGGGCGIERSNTKPTTDPLIYNLTSSLRPSPVVSPTELVSNTPLAKYNPSKSGDASVPPPILGSTEILPSTNARKNPDPSARFIFPLMFKVVTV